MRALASGLRVQSAADDPSGLAISENLQSKVNGLQQSVQNVQTANNLLNVADNVLDNVQRILSRVHSLVVQSRSDINSKDQLSGIQSEIDSLLQEVNKISSEANFNGVKLFDGSHAAATTGSGPKVIEIASEPNPDGSASRDTVYDANFTGSSDPGKFIQNFSYLNPATDVQSSIVSFRVLSYSNNPVDPQFGALGQPGVLLQVSAYSDAGSQFGTAPSEQYIQAFPTGAGYINGATEIAPSGTGALLNFDIANLSPQDVGVAMTFMVTPGAPATPPSTSGGPVAISINDSGGEGGTSSINLPALNTNALNVSGISVLDQQIVDHYSNTVAGTASSNQMNADFAEVKVQNAIDQLSYIRAQVGAQSIAMQDDANDASIAIVNQTAAMSSIRDADIGAAATAMTKDRILTQFGTSVLAQMQANQQQLMSLMVAQSLR